MPAQCNTHAKKDSFAPFFLLLSAVLWSFCGLLVKSIPWNGLSLAAFRGAISFIVSCAVLYLSTGSIRISLNRIKVLAGFCYFMQGILLIAANTYTTAGNATVLQNSSPLYIILMNAVFLSQKPRKLDVITCFLLLIGMGLAVAGNFSSGGMLGNIFALASGIFYAGTFFLNKQAGANPLESLVLGNGMYAVLIPSLLRDAAVPKSTPSTWCCVLAFSILAGSVAWLCFSRGIRSTPALKANFITMLEPVMSPIWTFLFLHEHMSALSVLGCVWVIATLLVYNAVSIRSSK